MLRDHFLSHSFTQSLSLSLYPLSWWLASLSHMCSLSYIHVGDARGRWTDSCTRMSKVGAPPRRISPQWCHPSACVVSTFDTVKMDNSRHLICGHVYGRVSRDSESSALTNLHTPIKSSSHNILSNTLMKILMFNVGCSNSNPNSRYLGKH